MNGGRLRIVHCFRAPVGGVFRHVSDLAEAQERNGHAVGVICDATTGGAFEEERLARLSAFLALGLKRVPMRRQVAPSDIAATFRLMREVRALDPDVLHAHGAKGGAYARTIGTLLRASGSRVARIYSPHGGSLHHDAASLGGRVYFAAERMLERMSDALIFVSQYEADVYAAKVGRPRRPFVIVRNGLRPEEFEPVVPVADARDFLFIGEVRALKGPDVFIEALAALAAEGRPATAWMVGQGPERAEMEALAAAKGLGDRLAFRDPMPARQAFALARTVVIPSRAESMPYIVLEAVAAGRPIVTTRVGGIPEIFGPEAGRLIPPGDAAALTAATREQLAGAQGALAVAEGLREQIRAGFSLEAMAAAIDGVYRSVTITRI